MSHLGLAVGKPKHLRFAEEVKDDLRLLEVDEALLQEIVTNG